MYRGWQLNLLPRKMYWEHEGYYKVSAWKVFIKLARLSFKDTMNNIRYVPDIDLIIGEDKDGNHLKLMRGCNPAMKWFPLGDAEEKARALNEKNGMYIMTPEEEHNWEGIQWK